MKKSLFALILSFCLISCSSDDNVNSNCNFLLDVGVDVDINLNFPEFNNLLTVGNPVRVPGHGNGGVIVINIGSGYLAWDAADPTHPVSSCSVLTPSGFEATCGCEDANKFSLSNGLPITENLACGLLNYRVIDNGDILNVSN